MINIINEGIVAMLPIYTDIGDITLIYTEEDTVHYDKPLRSFISSLLHIYSIDINAHRDKYKALGIKENPPLVLGDNYYTKIKTRSPRCKGDGAYGYVRLDYIDHIRSTDPVKVYLVDGRSISSLESYATVCINYCMTQSIYRRITDSNKAQ